MIRYATGNLLRAGTDALVNTVNTVGVMGKGIALMFKDAFPQNFRAYEQACRRNQVKVGAMFVTEQSDLHGPRWIVNFPTKQHWRHPSRLEWVVDGLADLRAAIVGRGMASIAVPPLGAGNGGLHWPAVRDAIEQALADLPDVDVVVFEPAAEYHNVAKPAGVAKLTVARALIAEMIRRYSILGLDCSLVEAQKLAWFTQASIRRLGLPDPLRLEFTAHTYGPYSDALRHVMDGLDGSYLHCEKRLADAGPFDVIWPDHTMQAHVETFFATAEAKPYRAAIEDVQAVIDGFESPFGLELLATVDWLVRVDQVPATVPALSAALPHWPGGQAAGERKARIFGPDSIGLAIGQLYPAGIA